MSRCYLLLLKMSSIRDPRRSRAPYIGYFFKRAWPHDRSSGGLPISSDGLPIASVGLPIDFRLLPEVFRRSSKVFRRFSQVYDRAVDTCRCFVCNRFKFV